MNNGKYQVIEWTGTHGRKIKGFRTLQKAIECYYNTIKDTTYNGKESHRILINSFIYFDLKENKQYYYTDIGYVESNSLYLPHHIEGDIRICVRHILKNRG